MLHIYISPSPPKPLAAIVLAALIFTSIYTIALAEAPGSRRATMVSPASGRRRLIDLWGMRLHVFSIDTLDEAVLGRYLPFNYTVTDSYANIYGRRVWRGWGRPWLDMDPVYRYVFEAEETGAIRYRLNHWRPLVRDVEYEENYIASLLDMGNVSGIVEIKYVGVTGSWEEGLRDRYSEPWHSFAVYIDHVPLAYLERIKLGEHRGQVFVQGFEGFLPRIINESVFHVSLSLIRKIMRGYNESVGSFKYLKPSDREKLMAQDPGDIAVVGLRYEVYRINDGYMLLPTLYLRHANHTSPCLVVKAVIRGPESFTATVDKDLCSWNVSVGRVPQGFFEEMMAGIGPPTPRGGGEASPEALAMFFGVIGLAAAALIYIYRKHSRRREEAF